MGSLHFAESPPSSFSSPPSLNNPLGFNYTSTFLEITFNRNLFFTKCVSLLENKFYLVSRPFTFPLFPHGTPLRSFYVFYRTTSVFYDGCYVLNHNKSSACIINISNHVETSLFGRTASNQHFMCLLLCFFVAHCKIIHSDY